jgi:hypothetical protein
MIRESIIDPQYNMDVNFYNQIAHRSSIHFGIPSESPEKKKEEEVG